MDRTMQAVEAQLRAMGAEQFELGVLSRAPRTDALLARLQAGGAGTPLTNAYAERLVREAILETAHRPLGGEALEEVAHRIQQDSARMQLLARSRDEILSGVPWLKSQNARGHEIYIRPRGSAGLVLVDDLSAGAVAQMRRNGVAPAVVAETSPGNHQAWVRVAPGPIREGVATAIARELAVQYGGDPQSAHWRHLDVSSDNCFVYGPYTMVVKGGDTSMRTTLDAYMARFVHVTEHYGRQLADERGSYVLITRPLTREVVQAHLRGEMSIGLYLLDARDRCAYGVLDHDGYRAWWDGRGQLQRTAEDGVAVLQEVRARLAREGIEAAVEQSRRGAHLWVFAAEPVAARDMRALLHWAAGERPMELYPKQDSRGAGVGSQIRAPLGIHLASGERYGFLDPQGRLVAPTLAGQVEYLAGVRMIDIAREVARRPGMHEELARQDAGGRGSTDQPGLSRAVQHQAAALRERSAIRNWVAGVRCEEVVGAYVALDRRGVGHCPWPEHHAHQDRAPSFQVLSRAQRWTCYATGESGNAFDFVCRMEGLMPKAALAFCRERWPAQMRDEPTR